MLPGTNAGTAGPNGAAVGAAIASGGVVGAALPGGGGGKTGGLGPEGGLGRPLPGKPCAAKTSSAVALLGKALLAGGVKGPQAAGCGATRLEPLRAATCQCIEKH